MMKAKKLKIQALVDELLHPAYTDLSAGEKGGGECCQSWIG